MPFVRCAAAAGPQWGAVFCCARDDVDRDALGHGPGGAGEADGEGVLGRRVGVGPVAPGGELVLVVEREAGEAAVGGAGRRRSALEARWQLSSCGRSIPGRSQNSGMKHSGVAEADALELSAPKIATEPMRMANLRVATVRFYRPEANRTAWWRDCHVAGSFVGGHAASMTTFAAAESRFAPLPGLAQTGKDFLYLVLGLPLGIATFTLRRHRAVALDRARDHARRHPAARPHAARFTLDREARARPRRLVIDDPIAADRTARPAPRSSGPRRSSATAPPGPASPGPCCCCRSASPASRSRSRCGAPRSAS